MGKCMHCKEAKPSKLYNECICMKCRQKWEKEFYDRLEKKAKKG